MTKLSKILRIVAAVAFLTALAVNVKVTLTDPFVGMSEEAVAQTTSDTITVTSNLPPVTIVCDDGGYGYCYKLKEYPCENDPGVCWHRCEWSGLQDDSCTREMEDYPCQ